MARLCKLSAVALLSAWWAAPSQAQSGRTGSVPACLTNTGPAGQAFVGFFGTVASPVPYADVAVDGTRLEVTSDARVGLHALLYVYGRSSPSSETDEATDDIAPIELGFLAPDGAIVHTCAVTVVHFDAAVHDPASIAFGNCEFDLIDGPPLPLAGQLQRYERPEEVIEVASAPTAVLQTALKTDRILEIFGASPGVGTFTWIRDSRRFEDNLMGVCPFTVGDASKD